MKFSYFAQSDVGQRREKNEDSYLVNDKLGLFIVADGMGGHLGGDFASQLAVKTVEEIMVKLEDDPDATLAIDGAIDPADVAERMSYSIKVASMRIFEEAVKESKLRGMGTTTVALKIHDGKATIANVGDSRAYLLSQGNINQLTEDHSLVNEQLRAGFISEKDAKHHKLKNIITRSVGFQEAVEIDVQEHNIRPSDYLILCSDGLTNMLSDDEILKIIKKFKDPKPICEQFTKAANAAGGDDNITSIVVKFEES